MPRKAKHKELDTKAIRARLQRRGKPYWQAIAEGLHIGYRRPQQGAGAWISRRYDGSYHEAVIGRADDEAEADGVKVLDYWQAVNAVREAAKSPVGICGPYTVADAVGYYIEYLEGHRKTAYDVQVRMGAHALPELGVIKIAGLTADALRKWHAGLAKQPARLRTKPGDPQKYRQVAASDDGKRQRRASANRCLQQLKAALNYAFHNGKVSSDAAWRDVLPFKGADAARVAYLTVAECKRLLNACDRDFRPLVRAGLETGARYGELVKLTVSDFNPDAGTVAIRGSKSGKPRHVVLTEDGVSFFKQLCAGRSGSSPLFTKANGSAWRKSHQARPMRAACKYAKIDPAVGFHQLRHTWASLSTMNGVPLMVVARNLGHSDTRMVEKHYGHLAPSFIADAIRAGAPRFGKIKSNVRPLP